DSRRLVLAMHTLFADALIKSNHRVASGSVLSRATDTEPGRLRFNWRGVVQGARLLVDLRPEEVQEWLAGEVERRSDQDEPEAVRKPFRGIVEADSFHFRRRSGGPQLKGSFQATGNSTLIEFGVQPTRTVSTALILTAVGVAILAVLLL